MESAIRTGCVDEGSWGKPMDSRGLDGDKAERIVVMDARKCVRSSGISKGPRKFVELKPEPAAEARFVWARVYLDSNAGNQALRFVVSLDEPGVADLEMQMVFKERGFDVMLPKRVNYSAFSRVTQHTIGDCLQVVFRGSKLSGCQVSRQKSGYWGPLPSDLEKRHAIADKLLLDQMVEKKRQAMGEE